MKSGKPKFAYTLDQRTEVVAKRHSLAMRRYPKYQNRYQRRRAKRLARRKGYLTQQARFQRQRANARGTLWLRLFARLVRGLR